MPAPTPLPPASGVSDNDRLGLTLFIAAILHSIVILGITFHKEIDFSRPFSKPIDVILVHTQSEEAPDDAEKIAQFNQQASGSQDEDGRPSSPVTSTFPLPSSGVAATPMERQVTRVELVQAQQLLTTRKTITHVASSDKTQVQREADQPSRRERLNREMEIARLTAELEARQRSYAKRPKIHFIDATSAKSAVEAAYINDWVHRVEGIGNLNYPAQAKRDHISGKLILNVLLNNNGKVLKVQVAVSSGSHVLDEAAIQIVKISSPFPSFPEEMRKRYDQLMITRTWSFNTNIDGNEKPSEGG